MEQQMRESIGKDHLLFLLKCNQFLAQKDFLYLKGRQKRDTKLNQS